MAKEAISIVLDAAPSKMRDLYAMNAFGWLAVDVDRVNIDDLLDMQEGGIVRVKGNPKTAIQFFASENEALGCIAGWHSEDE